jgi:hypothetical protein
MTNDIFTEWAKDINRQMRKKSRKILPKITRHTGGNLHLENMIQ